MATLKGLMTTLSKKGLQEQRSEIIYNFTGGRTSSARELTPTEINRLSEVLKSTNPSQNSAEMDKKRKRLLAAIFGVFKKMNKQPSIEYVKALACRAAKVERFNDIPSERLNSLYNAFIHAQRDLNFSQRVVDGILQDLMELN